MFRQMKVVLLMLVVLNVGIGVHAQRNSTSRRSNKNKQKIANAKLNEIAEIQPSIDENKAKEESTNIVNEDIIVTTPDSETTNELQIFEADLNTLQTLKESDNRSSSPDDKRETELKFLNYIKNFLAENRPKNSETKETNRKYLRLDIEDNGNVFPDVIDIDNPYINEDHEEDFTMNRRMGGYGSVLEKKGRSGEVPGVSSMISKRFYRPILRRPPLMRGLMFNRFANIVPMTYSKINSRDVVRVNNVPHWGNRRFGDVPGTQEPIDDDPTTPDPYSNSYSFEPESVYV